MSHRQTCGWSIENTPFSRPKPVDICNTGTSTTPNAFSCSHWWLTVPNCTSLNSYLFADDISALKSGDNLTDLFFQINDELHKIATYNTYIYVEQTKSKVAFRVKLPASSRIGTSYHTHSHFPLTKYRLTFVGLLKQHECLFMQATEYYIICHLLITLGQKTIIVT